MKVKQPKTTDQLRAIFGLGKKRGCEKEDLEQMADEMTGGEVKRLSELSFDQANAMIKHLGGEPFAAAAPQPRRTVNYQRQKAGVTQIAVGRQLKLMNDLAAGRGITSDGLERLCKRMLKGVSKPRTTAETNKIIEALKAMNDRDARGPKEAA